MRKISGRAYTMTMRMRIQGLRALALASLILLGAGPAPSAGPESVTVEELKAMLKRNEPVVFIDVRTPEEFAEGHIPGSVSMPVDTLESVESLPRGGRIIIYCKAGKRSRKALEILSKKGFTGIAVLEGGLDAWTAAGGRVVGVPAPPN